MSVFVKRDRFPQVVLPYVKLKYIESTGTQYIDTEYKPNNNTRVVLDADVPKNGSKATYVLGVNEWVSGKYFQIRILTSGTTYISDFGSQLGGNTKVSPNGRMIFDKNKNTCIINDVSYINTDTDFQCSTVLKLLAGVNTSGTHIATPGKIYKCSVYDNDVLIRDYIPVKMKESEEVGLWDRVEGKFYGNAGKGTFVAGEVAA